MVYDPVDLDAALCFLEHSKRTHENWAEYLVRPNPIVLNDRETGSTEFHRECILEYEHIIDVFHQLVTELE